MRCDHVHCINLDSVPLVMDDCSGTMVIHDDLLNLSEGRTSHDETCHACQKLKGANAYSFSC